MKKLLNTILLIFIFSIYGTAQTNHNQIKEFKGDIFLNNNVVNKLLPNYNKNGIYVYYHPISVSISGDTSILCNDVYHYSCKHIQDTIKKQYLIKSITKYKNDKVNGYHIMFNNKQHFIDSSLYKNGSVLKTTRTYLNSNGIPLSYGSIIEIQVIDTAFHPNSPTNNTSHSPIVMVGNKEVKNGVWLFYNNLGKVVRREKYLKGVVVK